MNQLSLILPVSTRQEAERRGLDCDESVEERDRRYVGLVGAAIANLNFILHDAAEAGFEITLSAFHQDVARGPRRALVRGRMRRLAVDARL